MVEDVILGGCVKAAKWVIQDDDVSSSIYCSGKCLETMGGYVLA